MYESGGNPIQEEIRRKNTKMGKFFRFQNMVSTSIIKFLYALGTIGITITGILLMLGIVLAEAQGGGNIFLGFTIVILGNLLWRILCEAWILLFSIHDLLGTIVDDITNNKT